MKAFDGFLGGGSCFKSVGRIRLALSCNRLVVPDKSNSSGRMAEASLKESATHDIVWCHQSC